jgi:hypothetical protein
MYTHQSFEGVLRKKSCCDGLKPVLVMKTDENWCRDDAISVRKLVADQS